MAATKTIRRETGTKKAAPASKPLTKRAVQRVANTRTRKAGGSLAEYDAKRDFSTSPEPKPRVAVPNRSTASTLSFCVQKHLASHLHYDLRLEHDGVLLSWAVPKGPSLNPADKRMAVRVEDHPVAYGDFEGVIPGGYGAGVVLLWDRGTWTPEPGTPDVGAALARGELKFRLDGVKLKGSWVLVRTKQQASAGREQWLLIKHRDAWSGEIDVTNVAPLSVKGFGDFADVVAAHGGEPTEWRRSPPAKGGEAGTMIRDVLAQARAIAEGKPVTHAQPIAEKPKAGTLPRRTGAIARTPKSAASTVRASPIDASARPRLTNPSKVLYPATGFTKSQLVAYYRRVAPLILPHLAGRAVTLKRYPDGVEGKSFFEKHCAAHRPDWVRTVSVPTESGKTIDYCAIADERTLVWAANLAAIELHVPLALAAAPDTPTAMVFDLDPGEPATLKDCVPVALRLKGMLDGLKLMSVVKTSGGKGLHVLVPLNTPGVTFAQTKSFARAVALTLERDDPKRVIASMSRAARAGKVFIDWSQNDRNKTTACVYSVRARAEPSVSWPIDWADLATKGEPTPRNTLDPLMPAKTLAGFAASMRRAQQLP